MIAPAWMHHQVTAEQYESWSEEQCAGIEIVDGMVVVSPDASKRHNRLVKLIAVALEAAAGPDWNADFDFDVRLQDVPLTNRRPDVVVYRADTIDIMPARPSTSCSSLKWSRRVRRRPTGLSRPSSTRVPEFRTTGGSNSPLPASLSSIPTSSIRRPGHTVTVGSSRASSTPLRLSRSESTSLGCDDALDAMGPADLGYECVRSDQYAAWRDDDTRR